MKPLIAETGYQFAKGPGFNALNIYLDLRPDSDLAWESVETEIETAIKLGAKLCFELDLGLSQKEAYLRDPAKFFSRGIGVSAFEERIYRPYKEQIAAIILYRGTANFRQAIEADTSLYADFLDWKLDLFGNKEVTNHIFWLFSMELFMQYLHRVSACIIDEIPLIALLDLSEVTRPSEQAELLSQTFFPYILPGVKKSCIHFKGFGWDEPGELGSVGGKGVACLEGRTATLGVVLPEMGSVPYELFDKTIESLISKKISYRFFPESLMTDSWHELDQILVFSGAVSKEGLRMIQGFVAAEGEVVTISE